MKNQMNQYLNFLNYEKITTSTKSSLMDSGGSSNNLNTMLDENLDDDLFVDEEKIRKDIEMNSATSSQRFSNYIIDRISVIAFGFAMGIVLAILSPDFAESNFVDDTSAQSRLLDRLFGFVLVIIYYILFEATTGRSIGKYVTGTKIVNMQGEKPSFGTIIIRTLCRFIPFEQFSFLNSKASGWHDSISKTRVINVKHFLD